MPNACLIGFMRGMPYGIEVYSGMGDYRAMFYFLQNE